MPTLGTLVEMAAQGGGAATLDRRQHFEMLPVEPTATLLDETLSGGADQISHLQRRPWHLGLRSVLLGRGRQLQGIQRTGDSVEMARRQVQIAGRLFQIAMPQQQLDGAQIGSRLEPCLLMKNLRGKFQDVSEQSEDPFLVPRPGRGAVAADLDDDGFLDLAINCNNEPSVILRNEGVPSRHWLLVNTVGTVSNRDGIGAQVRIVSESGLEQHATVSTAGSYLSSGDKRVHFGLGGDKKVRLLEVRWPSRIVQRIENVAADQILTVQEPEDGVEQDP